MKPVPGQQIGQPYILMMNRVRIARTAMISTIVRLEKKEKTIMANRAMEASNALVIYGLLKKRGVVKGEYLLKAGRVSDHIYFIEKGLIRCFYIKGDKETCSWFIFIELDYL